MKINHVALWCMDLEAIKQFYQTYFEAQANTRYTNETKGFSSYFLSFEDGARLEIMQDNNMTPQRRDTASSWFGYAHLAFSTGSKQAVVELTDRLVGDGFECLDGPRWTGDGYFESVIADPEGNRIEITV